MTTTKTIRTTVTNVDPGRRVISGYIAIWDIPDEHGQFVVKGKTFKKTLSEHGPESIPYLLNNSRNDQFGRFTRIWEDEIGLAYEARLVPLRRGVYDPQGEQVIDSAANGYTFYHALNLEIIAERRGEDWGDHEILEARLYSASLLYVPFDLPTPVYDMCGRPITDLIVYLSELERDIKTRAARGLSTDEVRGLSMFVLLLGQALERVKSERQAAKLNPNRNARAFLSPPSNVARLATAR